MNILYIVTCILFLLNTSVSDKTNDPYTLTDVDKEWDIELFFPSDSTFLLRDRYRCNQVNQQGKCRLVEGYPGKYPYKVILNDTTSYSLFINMHGTKFLSYTSNVDGLRYSTHEDETFLLLKCDTVEIKSPSVLVHRGLNFTTYGGNLEERRILLREQSLIDALGRKKYIEIIGEGKSIHQARLNLKKCR